MYEEQDPIVQRLAPRQKRPWQQTAGGMLSILGGGKPNDQEDDLASKLQYEILKRDATRNPLDDELKRSQISAYNSMANAEVPEGFVRVGNKIEKDPTFEKPGLSVPEQVLKAKRTDDLIGTVEQNKVRRENISGAKEALPRVPQGLLGGMKVWAMKNFQPNNPILSDWQKVKAVGTDAQLLNTARTKGAISDREMELFARAAANDDLISAARMQPVLDRILASMDADESAKIQAYQHNFNEDPRTFLDVDPMETMNTMKSGRTPSIFGQNSGGQNSFRSPEEADASGLPKGTRVTVNGRPYEI